MSAFEIGSHQFDDRLVVFADVGFEFVESAREVLGRSVIGEQQSQERLDLHAGRLGSRLRPRGKRFTPLRRDLVDVAAPFAGLLLVRDRVAALDEFLGLGIQETR